MAGLNKRELFKLSSSVALTVILVREELEDGLWWVAQVSSKEGAWEVHTKLGKRKDFRTIDAAQEFFEEACPGLEEITLKMKRPGKAGGDNDAGGERN